mmetsp:Transcript_79502/g.192622  ORF Transcript_79502/g.192622 Transcript_79502/m.192622 type:complete len:247 (+) Transcript_79502:718-1458(+)
MAPPEHLASVLVELSPAHAEVTVDNRIANARDALPFNLCSVDRVAAETAPQTLGVALLAQGPHEPPRHVVGHGHLPHGGHAKREWVPRAPPTRPPNIGAGGIMVERVGHGGLVLVEPTLTQCFEVHVHHRLLRLQCAATRLGTPPGLKPLLCAPGGGVMTSSASLTLRDSARTRGAPPNPRAIAVARRIGRHAFVCSLVRKRVRVRCRPQIQGGAGSRASSSPAGRSRILEAVKAGAPATALPRPA